MKNSIKKIIPIISLIVLPVIIIFKMNNALNFSIAIMLLNLINFFIQNPSKKKILTLMFFIVCTILMSYLKD
jgi:cell division protein FtsW (lipid II flippase)